MRHVGRTVSTLRIEWVTTECRSERTVSAARAERVTVTAVKREAAASATVACRVEQARTMRASELIATAFSVNRTTSARQSGRVAVGCGIG